MEYLVVLFAEPRKVVVDGSVMGQTNNVLELEAGTHSVTLEPSIGYSPRQKNFVLVATTAVSPLVISFDVVKPAS